MNSIPEAAIELIKEFEGFRANAYPDPITHWQLPTIGYGTTIYPDGTDVKKGDTITEARASECLANHVAKNCNARFLAIKKPMISFKGSHFPKNVFLYVVFF